jgi:hypothetical protein
LTSTRGNVSAFSSIDHHGLERQRRFGVERADLGDHPLDVLDVDAAHADQPRHVAPREDVEIVEQRLHRRIEAILLAELDREAFLQRPGEDARRIEPLEPCEHALHPLDRAGELLRHRGRVTDEIAGIVQHFDQGQTDQPIGRILQVDRGLFR